MSGAIDILAGIIKLLAKYKICFTKFLFHLLVSSASFQETELAMSPVDISVVPEPADTRTPLEMTPYR